MAAVVPPHLAAAVPEVAVYLKESVGNSTRIDYGTGTRFPGTYLAKLRPFRAVSSLLLGCLWGPLSKQPDRASWVQHCWVQGGLVPFLQLWLQPPGGADATCLM